MSDKRDLNGNNLSMKVVKILFGVNMFALLCFILLAVFFIIYKQYDVGVMLVVVACLSGLNNYRMWKRIKDGKP